MTLNFLTTKGRKGLKGLLLLLLIVSIPLALGSFGKRAEASSHDAPAHGEEHAAPSHGGDHAAAPAAHEAVVTHEAPAGHAMEETGHGAPPAEHGATPAHGEEAAHGDAGGHGDAAHGGGHHAGPPLIYYANWAVLFVGVIMSGLYLIMVAKEGKPHHETILLAFVFVCMAYFLFISANYIPSMARHFDKATLTFVDGYHESPVIGFVKFIYRMVFGYFLMIYAIVGMEHH